MTTAPMHQLSPPLRLAKYVGLGLGALVMMLPFFWMVSASFMTPTELAARPLRWLPLRPHLDNYQQLLAAIPVGRMYLNSLIVGLANTAGILFTSAIAGYGLAKFRFPGRDLIFYFIIATLVIPIFVVIIPVFFIVERAGWIDSYAGLIVPHLATGFGVFLMRQYLLSIPDELLDAARVDGASEWRIFRSLVVPLSAPALGALGILAFVYQWNNFLWPLLVIRSQDMWTVPVGLNALQLYAPTPGTILMQLAGATAGVVPAIIVFLLLQRHFVTGIAMTGLKS
jgi:multiple sugar transport system permease protein